MSSSEWELLTISEDIEQGDTVSVELEDGSTTPMLFLSATASVVKLLDKHGKTRRFSASSLEELSEDTTSYITGKSEERLSARDILG